MITKANLHFRSRPGDEHRCRGIIAVEHDRPALEPHQEVTYCIAGRKVRAHVTAIRACQDRLPHVYADEVSAAEPVD
jgi:hypothetical protein